MVFVVRESILDATSESWLAHSAQLKAKAAQLQAYDFCNTITHSAIIVCLSFQYTPLQSSAWGWAVRFGNERIVPELYEVFVSEGVPRTRLKIYLEISHPIFTTKCTIPCDDIWDKWFG